MTMRAYQNKCILFLIILVEIGLLGLILWLKLFHK
jgi:hypothetical protein